jgi:hypothetical protein
VRSIKQGGVVSFLITVVIGCSAHNVKPAAKPSSREAESPTVDSIREFFNAVHLDETISELLDLERPAIDAKLQGMRPKGHLSPAQEQAIDELTEKVRVVLDDELSVDRVRQILTAVLQNSFSQQDIDALTAFYRSKSGKIVVAEFPSAIRAYVKQKNATGSDPMLRGPLPSAFGILFKPWENRDFAGVFSSDIELDIRDRLPAATRKFDEETEQLLEEIQTRLRQLALEYRAKIKAAGT